MRWFFGLGSMGKSILTGLGAGLALLFGIWRIFAAGQKVEEAENAFEDAAEYIATTRRMRRPADPTVDDDEWLQRMALRRGPTRKR